MPLQSKDVIKTFANTPYPLPSFYVLPYADPNPGHGDDYSLIYYPPADYECDINLAFITPSEASDGTFGNTCSDTYLKHLRDKVAVQQFVSRMLELDRSIYVSYIDTPHIHWDKVNIENFVRNTEGEIAADGTLFTNYLMETYKPVGRMWDAETDGSAEAMAEVIKACFLRGIQRDPNNYVFIYTTYENRSIDAIILSTPFDSSKSPVDKALCDLGFTQISDFITKRGSLSFLETMSYGAPAANRFQEADNYALQLAKGDASKLNAMRKFISIGVDPDNSEEDAIAIARACDPDKEDGYGRFMVWGANCPAGLSLFKTMAEARDNPKLVANETADVITVNKYSNTKGNRNRFFTYMPKQNTVADVATGNLMQRLLHPFF